MIILLVYAIVRWPDQGPSTQIYLRILSTTLVLKFNLSTEFFGKWKEHFLYAMYTPKINFLNALNRICLNSKYVQFKAPQERHK